MDEVQQPSRQLMIWRKTGFDLENVRRELDGRALEWSRSRRALWDLLGYIYEQGAAADKDFIARGELVREVLARTDVSESSRWDAGGKSGAELILTWLLGIGSDSASRKSNWLRTLRAAAEQGIPPTEGDFVNWLEREGGEAAARSKPEPGIDAFGEFLATLEPLDADTEFELPPPPPEAIAGGLCLPLVQVHRIKAGGPIIRSFVGYATAAAVKHAAISVARTREREFHASVRDCEQENRWKIRAPNIHSGFDPNHAPGPGNFRSQDEIDEYKREERAARAPRGKRGKRMFTQSELARRARGKARLPGDMTSQHVWAYEQFEAEAKAGARDWHEMGGPAGPEDPEATPPTVPPDLDDEDDFDWIGEREAQHGRSRGADGPEDGEETCPDPERQLPPSENR